MFSQWKLNQASLFYQYWTGVINLANSVGMGMLLFFQAQSFDNSISNYVHPTPIIDDDV